MGGVRPISTVNDVSAEIPTEVLVWGGGTGGVAAALQAARSGAQTVLLTPGPWLGGMVSAAGVCAPDGNELTPWQTGLWGALLRELAMREPGGLDHNWVSCFGYRPATAEAILRQWLAAEPLLRWCPNCRLLEIGVDRGRIGRLVCEQGSQTLILRPRIVIDGSDRGDLLPLAGAGFRLGWEARERWGEPSAPAQAELESNPFFQRQPVQSPTWVVMGRLEPDQVPPAPPTSAEGSEPSLAAGPASLPAPFAAATAAFGLEKTLSYGRLPGGLVMLNWPLAGNDWHDDLGRAFGADPSGRDRPDPAAETQLEAEMQRHSRAFAAALEQASGGRLQRGACFPSREQALQGELHGSSDCALMPYWREGRRLVGLDLVIEQQLLPAAAGACIAPLPLEPGGRSTAIAVGNYANDHHYPGGDWPLAPKSCRWGGRWSGTPFTIPYGALVSADVSNLLAADKCFSVSHMANGATRLQPLILNIGQASGLAAALCVRQGLAPAELPVSTLQRALIEDGRAPAGPFPLWDTPWHHPDWRRRQLAVWADPSLLDLNGRMVGAVLDPRQAPSEPQERAWRGLLRPDGQGGFRLELATASWPLITQEPALHHWLMAQDRARPVTLIGCANPWGPWLRVSRLQD